MKEKEIKNTVLKDEDLYCYAKTAVVQSKGDYNNSLFIDAKCQFGNINFAFWMTENIPGFKADDPNTWPISTEQFFKVSFDNFSKVNNEFKNRSSIALQGKYKSNCNFCVINEEDISEDIVKLIKKDRSNQIKSAKNAITNDSYWKNKECAKFLRETIVSHEKFLTCPAAIKNHHAYESGLLVHSYEVWKISKAIADACEDLYPNVIDNDVLNLSSWLHDIGKIETYSMENGHCNIDNEKENLVNHIIRSNTIFQNMAQKYDFDEKFKDRVSHCILGHQDRKDWDTPIEPITIESIILAKADKISSSIAKFD